MKFSIVIVTLNAGENLLKTIHSIKKQKYTDYEIIIKDGGSDDNSISTVTTDNQTKVYIEKDSGIYDAMNQALDNVSGDLIIFLNSGDTFYNDNVLSTIDDFISKVKGYEPGTIFYGDCYTVNRNSYVKYPDVFDDYTCFTKTLCHQATVYTSNLFYKRKFNLNYKIASDFEYYVHSYKHGVKFVHIPIVMVNYLGGGASEIYINRKKSINESEIILKENFSEIQFKKIKKKMLLTGLLIKRWLAGSKLLYKPYSNLAGWLNRIRDNNKEGI